MECYHNRTYFTKGGQLFGSQINKTKCTITYIGETPTKQEIKKP